MTQNPFMACAKISTNIPHANAYKGVPKRRRGDKAWRVQHEKY